MDTAPEPVLGVDNRVLSDAPAGRTVFLAKIAHGFWIAGLFFIAGYIAIMILLSVDLTTGLWPVAFCVLYFGCELTGLVLGFAARQSRLGRSAMIVSLILLVVGGLAFWFLTELIKALEHP